ncbi:NAD(P)-dependent alcohol dehydrogenase [Sphingomonas oligophenolica]|uniref:NAD(P)-dependent alcohol dehydrogenase n=1 Tax=Sphingomonas oligophenolica TaxID=301154 RepID=A0ABU9XYD7_9SPHN
MKTWRLTAGASSLDDLGMVETEKPAPGPGEILIRVHACSLNYRDQAIVKGQYFGGPISRDLTPLSDGAGIVEAVGDGVTGYKPGDRVAGTFFQNWRAGPPNPNPGVALGAVPADGMLSEYVVLPEQGIVPLAETLSFEEAATLPCAGVTAWNALMEGPRAVGPGSSVLILGTGGVSLLALAIAKAAGARVIATSSSDEKLARVRALCADEVINYRTTPDWGVAAARLAGGGVDHVVEVGGAGTLQQSMAAVGYNGEVALIGVLTREGETGPHALMLKGASLRGIFVGSASMAIALNRAIDATGIKPQIDRVFAFDQARQAYEYQASPDLFGKVVIRVD